MQTTELIDTLDRWLATEGLHPAEAAQGGALKFQTRSGSSLAAKLMPDGRLELLSSPGYADEQTLRALMQDLDEDEAVIDPFGLLPVLAWRDEGAHWQAEIRLDDGLLVLARSAQPPASPEDWASCTGEFERECIEWAANLSPVQVAFEAPFRF